MLRWALIVLGCLVGIAVIIALVGMLIPATHVARASMSLAQPQDTVWSLVAGVESYPRWWSYADSVETRTSADGGVVYVLRDRHAQSIAYQVIESQPPRRFVMRIADDDLPFGGTWTYEVDPGEGGTVLTITEDGVIKNPLFRFMARFVFGYHATMESFMRDLARHFGVEPAITRLDA